MSSRAAIYICQIVNVISHQFIAEIAKAHKVQSRTFNTKTKANRDLLQGAQADLPDSRLPACRNGTADFVKRQQNREFSSLA